MKTNSLKIKDKRSNLKSEARSIIRKAKDEKRKLTREEAEQIENIKEEIQALDAQLEEVLDSLSDETPETNEGEEEEKTEEETPEYDEEDFSEDEEDEENKSKRNHKNSMNKERFSLIKAVRSVVNNQKFDALTEAVIERGREQAKRSGVSVQGQIQLPTETRAAITVAAEGDDIVATDLFDIMTPLRAKNVLSQAGAKVLGNLVGDVQVPIMTASNVTWEGETDSAQDGAGAFSHVTLSPKRLTAYIDISKMMLAQDSLDAEAVIREDLVNAINTKLEATILGDGDGTVVSGGAVVAPFGIFNAAVCGAGDTVSSFADLVNAEADIEDANILGECKYVMSNKAKAALRAMAKSAKSTELVYENNAVDGTPSLNTSHVAGKKFIYGDWSNLAIGQWSNIDLTVDQFTLAKDGKVRLVINAFFDAKVLRTSAFKTGAIA